MKQLKGWTGCFGRNPDLANVGAERVLLVHLATDHRGLALVYTSLTTDNVLIPKILSELTGGIALTASAPFRRTIEKYASEDLFQLIGAEHRKGRSLFIGTTALDAARPVVWNFGDIANRWSGQRLS